MARPPVVWGLNAGGRGIFNTGQELGESYRLSNCQEMLDFSIKIIVPSAFSPVRKEYLGGCRGCQPKGPYDFKVLGSVHSGISESQLNKLCDTGLNPSFHHTLISWRACNDAGFSGITARVRGHSMGGLTKLLK